jgi:hypothetical protein
MNDKRWSGVCGEAFMHLRGKVCMKMSKENLWQVWKCLVEVLMANVITFVSGIEVKVEMICVWKDSRLFESFF